jgi:hypothetical protein
MHSAAPKKIENPAAWYGPDLARKPDDWIYTLSEEDLQCMDRALKQFASSGLTMGEISRATFPLGEFGDRLDRVLQALLHGRGFILLRGLPLERYSKQQAALAYLGIGAYLGKFRSQNARGHLLGHVRDTGADISDAGTRYYQTNRQLEFHTDSADIVGLLCLRPAKHGGESLIASSVTIYNEMNSQFPELVEALFNPYPTDRRGEVPEGMQAWFDLPVFNWYADQLSTIYVGQYIRTAQASFPAARRLTELEFQAIAKLDELANDPRIHLKMDFRMGDMQFLHNHQILHSRTDFEDWEAPEQRRHLYRLWLAPENARPLPPDFAVRYGSVTPGNRGGIVVKGTRLTFDLETP